MTDSLRPIHTAAGTSGTPDDDWKARALHFRAQRQTVLASNIANADTPRYKAVDLSFSSTLKSTISAIPAPPLTNTAPQHLPLDGSVQRSTVEFVQFVQPTQTNLDGNTVDMDRERAAFAQNAILYQLAVMSLDDEVKEFKLASASPQG